MKTQREILDEMAATEMDQGTYDRVSLIEVSEKAAWQNAAESLPAAPEHCSGCLHPDGHNGETHCYGTIEHPEPDAPVEAKEKELCSSKTSDGLPCNALGDHEIHTHTREGRSDPSILWRDTPIPVAEPKPTPSTPVPEADEMLPCEDHGEVVCRVCRRDPYPLNLRRDAHPDYLFSLYMRMAKAHETEGWLGVTKVYVAEREEMQNRFGYAKSQPDSSSISTEQTFKEWWRGYHPRFGVSGEGYEGVAEAAWNAAKGQR